MSRKLMYVTRLAIRWGDMDANGHVNNAVYFRYMEQARIEWFNEIGCMQVVDGVGPVIVNAHCSFLRQIKYPGDLEISVYAGPAGRSSFETWVEMRRADTPEVLAAEGGAKVVWVDFALEKSVPLPSRISALLPATA